MNDKLLKTGIVGTVITALCCFMPLLFGFAGLSAVVSYFDYVLLSFLAVFVLITIYAVILCARKP